MASKGAPFSSFLDIRFALLYMELKIMKNLLRSQLIALPMLTLATPLFSMNGAEVKSPYEKELCAVVYGELDYLLWFTNQNGFQSPLVATGKSPDLGSQWSSGVRATLGAQSSCWDTQLSYSYYSTHPEATANAEIATILSSSPSTTGIFEVKERWNLNFNRIDLEFGRKILFGNLFLFRPFFGLQGIDAGQTFDLDISTVFLDLTTGQPSTDLIESNSKNSLLGIGPRVGFSADFQLGAGFGFFGSLAANILWSRFNLKQDYNQTDYFSSSSPTVLVDQTQSASLHDSIFNCDLVIGFGWRRHFPQKNLELLLKADWEQHYYADTVRFQDFYLQKTSQGTAAYSTNGNLTLSGFTFGISLRY